MLSELTRVFINKYNPNHPAASVDCDYPGGSIPKINHNFYNNNIEPLNLFYGWDTSEANLKSPMYSNFGSINNNAMDEFCRLKDVTKIEKCFEMHFSEVATGAKSGISPIYHLVYSYLIENTGLFRIMEEIISTMTQTENLGFPSLSTAAWLNNTNDLFYKEGNTKQFKGIKGDLQLDWNLERQVAYFKLFGTFLSHQQNDEVKKVIVTKSSNANTNFFIILEKALSLWWDAATNKNNSSGQNNTDLVALEELFNELSKLLLSRRSVYNNLTHYGSYYLSRTEMFAFFQAYWFHFNIASNTDLITELNCEAITPHERLLKLGKLANIKPHPNSNELLALASELPILLRMLENYQFNSPAVLSASLSSSNSMYQMIARIIVNYEKATKRNIKSNSLSNIRTLLPQ